MGAAKSKTAPEPGVEAAAPTPSKGKAANAGDLRKEALQATATGKLILDAHCHYFDYMQKTEGMAALTEAMTANKVGFAILMGCAFKKTWVGEPDSAAPAHHLYDDGDLYHYSATDGNLWRHIVAHKNEKGESAVAKLAITGCGLNLSDYSAGEECQAMLYNYPAMVGIGELTLQCDDINNVTVKGGNWTYTEPSLKKITKVAKEKKRPLIVLSDARSVSTKPYRAAFEYIDEIERVCSEDVDVKVIWVNAGASTRGQWKEYIDIVKKLVSTHSNLYLSFTPDMVTGKVMGISREAALEIAESCPHRVVLGTTVRGLFKTAPPAAFGEAAYGEQCKALTYFADQIETRAGPGVATSLRYRTACYLYNLPMPDDPNAEKVKKAEASKGATLKNLINKNATANTEQTKQMAFLSSLAYGGGGGTTKMAVCPPSRTDKVWDTIDCHLHLLDFLQKSSGTSAALKAMDGCACKKALVFGMPCCKKWLFYRKDKPLYYQDDNAPCYVYAFADQMVADAWLALEDKDRARIAPTFAAFDPTDLAAIDHVQRMYLKYPKMWRGIGELMCRHDDLTTMLLDKEIPRINHPALMMDGGVYAFAVKHNLPVQVHHNSDRVGDNDGTWEYVYEVEEVLKKFPTLKLVWVHAGVSRRCSEPNHHEMIQRMCDTYDNMLIDISWVVWEDVICDEKGVIKPGWVECIQKHHTKFFIGSDNVAQYFPIKDTSINLLAGNITKYYQLFDKLPPEAAENVAYNNAENLYFKEWEVPTGEVTNGANGLPDLRYARTPSFYQTECLDPEAGKFVLGKTDIDDDGMY